MNLFGTDGGCRVIFNRADTLIGYIFVVHVSGLHPADTMAYPRLKENCIKIFGQPSWCGNMIREPDPIFDNVFACLWKFKGETYSFSSTEARWYHPFMPKKDRHPPYSLQTVSCVVSGHRTDQ